MPTDLPSFYHHPLPNGNTYPMRLVRAGYFIMGSEAEDAWNDEKPEIPVHIPHDFYIGVYPVTQAVWQVVAGDFPKPQEFVGDQRPVTNVSWIDIVEGNQDDNGKSAFLEQINKTPLATNYADLLADFKFRLPTEAEWEYAAKGGHLRSSKNILDKKAADLYSSFAGSNKLKEVGWYDKNSNGMTHPVGQKRPNELGLYDLSGNVYEWCYDWRNYNNYENIAKELKTNEQSFARHPYIKDKGTALNRVLRGGGYFDSPRGCRVSYRDGIHPSDRWHDYGFRLVFSFLSLV